MKKKADSKQVKANKVLRLSAVAASAESAIKEPPPDTWSARMPAYTYTVDVYKRQWMHRVQGVDINQSMMIADSQNHIAKPICQSSIGIYTGRI